MCIILCRCGLGIKDSLGCTYCSHLNRSALNILYIDYFLPYDSFYHLFSPSTIIPVSPFSHVSITAFAILYIITFLFIIPFLFHSHFLLSFPCFISSEHIYQTIEYTQFYTLSILQLKGHMNGTPQVHESIHEL